MDNELHPNSNNITTTFPALFSTGSYLSGVRNSGAAELSQGIMSPEGVLIFPASAAANCRQDKLIKNQLARDN